MSKPYTAPSVTKRTGQYMQNLSFDEDFDVLVFIPLEVDGTNARRPQTKLMNLKITEDGDDTYIGYAPIGTAQATAGWQCKKIAVSGDDTTILYADGNANFDNSATNLTSLTYS